MGREPEGVELSWMYLLIESSLGTAAIVWDDGAAKFALRHVYLPRVPGEIRSRVFADHPLASEGRCAEAVGIAKQLFHLLAGEPVSLPLSILALDACRPFQRDVLVAEHGIPRGCVSTYGRLAAHLGKPKAARAVGWALANNPFPLIVPCHRCIQADGRLGGFQGGLDMKRSLLEMEGVTFTSRGRVQMDRVFY
jgi:methylated-DNA-[protein]-cysteine S-methyltransferase